MSDTYVSASLWTDGLEQAESKPVGLAVERGDDHDEIAVHTMIDGTGSHCSFFMSRENALRLAADVLQVVALERG